MTKIRFEAVVFDTLGWIWGIRSCIDEIKRSLPEAEKRERVSLERIAGEFGWDYESYSEKESGIDSKFEYWIPRIAAYSIIALLHALLETQLRALADRLCKMRGESLKPKDMHGDPVQKSKVYLTKVVGLRVGEHPAWQKLQDLEKLRHVIVHRRGLIPTDNRERKKMQKVIDKYPGQLSEHGGELRISLDLCSHFLNSIEDFFRQLFRESGLPEDIVV